MRIFALFFVLFVAHQCVAMATDSGPNAASDQWRKNLREALRSANNADANLALYLLSNGDTTYLDQAYTLGKSNPKVLWLAALEAPCQLPSMTLGCKPAVEAAKALTRADPDNAMAWLTLAYATERAIGRTSEILDALKHAARVPRFHDYGFDLMKASVSATALVSVPDGVLVTASGTPSSVEHARMQAAADPMTVLVAHFVTGWVKNGCTTFAEPPEAPQVAACDAAKELFKRGDSLMTLDANATAVHKLEADLAKGLAAAERSPNADKVLIETYAVASSQLDFAERLVARSGSSDAQ